MSVVSKLMLGSAFSSILIARTLAWPWSTSLLSAVVGYLLAVCVEPCIEEVEDRWIDPDSDRARLRRLRRKIRVIREQRLWKGGWKEDDPKHVSPLAGDFLRLEEECSTNAFTRLPLSQWEEKQVSAKVTENHGRHGMINGDIFYDLDVVSGFAGQLRVGIEVFVRCRRRTSEGIWVAENIILQDDPFRPLVSGSSALDFLCGPRKTTMMGKEVEDEEDAEADVGESVIVQVDRIFRGDVRTIIPRPPSSGLSTEQGPSFRLGNIPVPFRLEKGDWLDLSLAPVEDEKPGEGESSWTFSSGRGEGKWSNRKVAGVKATRELVSEGEITFLGREYGLINRSIKFYPRDCTPGYVPQNRDSVKVVAIENCFAGSRVGSGGEWRAVEVVPLSLNQLTRRRVTPGPLASDSVVQKELSLLWPKDGLVLTLSAAFEGDEQEGELEEVQSSLSLGQLVYNEERFLVAKIYNSRPEGYRVSFKEVTATGQIVEDADPTDESSRVLAANGGCVVLRLKVLGKFVGSSRELVVFTLDPLAEAEDAEPVSLGRYISFSVEDPATVAVSSGGYRPNETGTPRRSKLLKFENEPSTIMASEKRILGVRSFKKNSFAPVKYKQYPIKEQLWTIFFERGDIVAYEPSLVQALSPRNYVARFSMLLHLEEMEVICGLRRFDLEQESFEKHGEFLCLCVPGLREGRPSLMLGDKVIAKTPAALSRGVASAEEFVGEIHELHRDKLFLKFAPSFHVAYGGEVMDIHFEHNRGPQIRMHHSLEEAVTRLGDGVLFPRKAMSRPAQLVLADRCRIHPKSMFYGLAPATRDAPREEPPPPPAVSTSNDPAMTSSVEPRPSGVTASAFHPVSRRQRRRPVDLSNFLPPHVQGMSLSERQDMFRRSYMQAVEPNFVMPRAPLPTAPASRSSADSQSAVRPLAADDMTSVLSNAKEILWFNPFLNARQKAAVKRILEGKSRPLPYIIFGPPGTGKTMTLVEAILQVCWLIPSSRILVATPSNSSADLVAQRLVASGLLTPRTMIRLLPMQREMETVPEELHPFSRSSLDVVEAVRRRICVTTCTTAGQIYQAYVREGHFTHVFVDEAGQATEPEVLVPLCQAKISVDTQLVLAGDPLQLGPVLSSRYALAFGLGISLLERLCGLPCYQRNEVKFSNHGFYDPLLVTKLVENYRSHATLLSLYSDAFYAGELLPRGSNLDRLASLPFLPKQGVPLVFHGVRGQDLQEENSPSFYNPAEISQVYFYLNDLMNAGISFEEIGVVTPYRKQVEKIRQFLSEFDVPLPKIGSTEEFQGREYPVIILSTVRTQPELLEIDRAHTIGFLDNPKRFNVAISRAKNLLIVIGDPNLLRCDRHWLGLLKKSVSLGAYTGSPLENVEALLEEAVDEDDQIVGIEVVER